MSDAKLTEVSKNFWLKDYNTLSSEIVSFQDIYIKSRLKWFWRLPLLCFFAARKLTLLFTAPEIHITAIAEKGYRINYSQKMMLVGKTEFWALLLMRSK